LLHPDRQELRSGQRQVFGAGRIKQLGNVLERDDAASAANVLGALPIGYARPMNARNGRYCCVATEGGNDRGCWFHPSLVANITTDRKRSVAISEKDAGFFCGYDCAMLSEWLQEALKSSGVGQSAMSRHLTLSLGRSIDRAAVNKMTKGTRAIAADELKVIERVTGHEAPTELEVPVKGFIGAGESVEAVSDMDNGEMVEAPRDARPGTVAAIVRGNSMFPTLRDGWTIYWSRMLPAKELINDLCVVHLEDGRIMVKVIRAGSAPDFWTLQSVNPMNPDLVDQVVRWVSPIDWIKPR